MKKRIKEWIYNHYFQDKIKLIHSLHTELEVKEAQNKKLELEAQHLAGYKDSLETEFKKVVDYKDSLEIDLKKVVDYKDNLEIEFGKVVDNKEKVESDFRKIADELRQVSEQSSSRIRDLEEASREREAQIKRSVELLGMLLSPKIERRLGSFTYGDCICLIRLINDQNLLNIIKQALTNIWKSLFHKSEKIKIVFLAPLGSTWPYNDLYNLLKSKDDLFDVVVCVPLFNHGTEEQNVVMYKQACSYFEGMNYSVVKGYDIKTGKHLDFIDEMNPDVVFHLTPHRQYLNEKFDIANFPLNILNVYTPYGFSIVNDHFNHFNRAIQYVSWKVFCESLMVKEMFEKYSKMGSYNVEASGHPKLDSSYTKKYLTNFKWKATSAKNYKILYAPHHTAVDADYTYGTFHKNHDFFYNLAKTSEDISFVIKPHPLLMQHAVSFGIFKNDREYNEYMQKWDELPNASFAGDQDYQSIMASSDAMILDSISMMADYFYYSKPMLFLTKDCKQEFSEFGKALLNGVYQLPGTDFTGIENFIQSVVKNGDDYLKPEREAFFSRYLDYVKKNGMLASEYIFQTLLELTKENHSAGTCD